MRPEFAYEPLHKLIKGLSRRAAELGYDNFLSLAQGANEAAVFLNAGSPTPGHGQSMIATGSLNFSNVSQTVTT